MSYILDHKISELDLELRQRTLKSILRIGTIETVRDLTGWTPGKLLRQYGFGKVQLAEVRSFLGLYGLKLAPDEIKYVKQRDPEYIKARISATEAQIGRLNITLTNWKRKLGQA